MMSPIGPSRHSATRQNLVAIGGIADIERFSAGNDLKRLTLSGHCSPISTLAQTTVCFDGFCVEAASEEDLVDQLFNSTEKRLARLLLLLANFGKEGRPEPIIAKISQEVLAEMIGTTRSRVSRFMNKFRELGFIDYNGHLEVHSSLLSVVLNEQGRTVAPTT
jgi:hypothetical protein